MMVLECADGSFSLVHSGPWTSVIYTSIYLASLCELKGITFWPQATKLVNITFCLDHCPQCLYGENRLYSLPMLYMYYIFTINYHITALNLGRTHVCQPMRMMNLCIPKRQWPNLHRRDPCDANLYVCATKICLK